MGKKERKEKKRKEKKKKKEKKEKKDLHCVLPPMYISLVTNPAAGATTNSREYLVQLDIRRAGNWMLSRQTATTAKRNEN